jgi:PIN domain nuclease of toxin-antitoxin system
VAQFLLDTHALLWFIQGDPQLSDQARDVISDNTNQLYFSVASLWEMSIKLNIGKLKIGYSIADV